MDMRNDFGSYQDPIATYTSLGPDVEPNFVTDNFPFDRRTSMLSAASSGHMLSFGSSPTDAASSSIPTTPVNEAHRSAGPLTPADMMLTPESPCPSSWRWNGRVPASAAVNTYAPQRYPQACQDLTRSMVNAGATSFHDDPHASHHLSGRDMAFAALDPIQTQYSGSCQKSSYYPPFMTDYKPSRTYPSASPLSDDEALVRSWGLDGNDMNMNPRHTHHRDQVRLPRNRKAKTRHGPRSDGMEHTLKGLHRCPIPGCHDKRFRRKEHLRRHEQSKHGQTKFECLQGRILGSRFCEKVHGIFPISRSDNVNQHSCTHVINGMGKTRNALCELEVAERCIRRDVRTQSDLDKANRQCEALRLHMSKNAEESALKGVRTAKPKANVHISHDIMASLGFDVSRGCPMGDLHVFDGDGSQGPLCMAFIGTSESRDEMTPELDGFMDYAKAAAKAERPRKAKL